MATEKKAVLVRFYPEVHEKLQKIAKKNKRTVTNLVEYLVEKSLAQDETEKVVQANITTNNQSGGKNEVNTI
jgi:predicted transcriptional regulator